MAEKDQVELIGNILNITRDQLTRSMNLNAELEALLGAEKAKNAELQQELDDLKKETPKDKK